MKPKSLYTVRHVQEWRREAAKQAAASDQPPQGQPDVDNDMLGTVTALLAELPEKELKRLTKAKFSDAADAKLAFFRAVRAQQFQARQRNAIIEHARWVDKQFDDLKKAPKVVPRTVLDMFYSRLQNDDARRRSAREKAVSEKLAKEEAILKSSALFAKGRKHS